MSAASDSPDPASQASLNKLSPGPSAEDTANTTTGSTSVASLESPPSPSSIRSRKSSLLQLTDSDARAGPSKGVKGKAKFIPNRIKRYHERSLDGCLTCRKRRVKCDEARPTCRRCACGNRDCVYADFPQAMNSSSDPATRFTEQPAAQSGLQVSALVHPDVPPCSRSHGSLSRYGSGILNYSGGLQHSDRSSASTSFAIHPTGMAQSASPAIHSRCPSSSRCTTEEHWSRGDGHWAEPYQQASYENQKRRAPSYLTKPPTFPIDISKVKLPELPPGLGFDNLEPYFPTYEQQSLFRHYILEVAPQLCVMQIPLAENRWIRHHATFALQNPAGSNGFEDALRSAILSMASLDIGHKLSQAPSASAWSQPESQSVLATHGRGPSNLAATARTDHRIFDGLSPNGSASSTTSNVLLELSNFRREECLRLLRSALLERVAPLHRADAATMLATVLGLGTRDRLAAQQDWQEALLIASKAIAELGGPAAFVDMTDPASLFLLEQIACFDALSSLTSDDYTLFLQPWDDWWYALMDSPRSITEDSVLQTFGLQRGMIDMLARMTRVEATRRELQLRTGVTIILSEQVGAGSPPNLPPEYEDTRLWLESTACALVAEIPIWAKMSFPKDDTRSLQSLLPAIMNHLYLAAAELYIYSVIFSKPADHVCFHEPTSIVLDRSEEAIQVGITKGLLLPISFAAFSASESDRSRIQNLLNDLRPYYKFDLERMEKLNEHLWGLVDSGLTPSDWQLFLKSVGCFNWAF